MNTQDFPLISLDSNEEFNDLKKLFHIKNDLPVIIAGPCGVENLDNLDKTARFLSQCGFKFLRGGLYKPRTSPYSFQGLRSQGLTMMKEIGKKYDMITVSEITDVRDIELFSLYIDVLQIGSRNMQNFELLKEVGRSKKPVILKRGMGSTLREFLFSAEYIALEGNRNIIMCERGIRTFENSVRNMLDIASIALIKKYIKLPVIADLSHSLGRKDIVNQVAQAVIALGTDGFMIEVHPDPNNALSDKNQQLNFDEVTELLKSLNKKKYM